MWLELTRSCNLSCIHCYAEATPNEEGSNLPFGDIRKVISELAEARCSAIQLTEGEPLLTPYLMDIIGLLVEAGFKYIELFSNLTLLTDDQASVLKRYGVRVATSIYASEGAVHDAITRTKGGFEKTVQGVRLLRSYGIPMRIAVIVLPLNAERVEERATFVREELGVEHVTLGPVLPAGRGREVPPVPPDWWRPKLTSFAPLACIRKEDFAVRLHGHSCWYGRLCISPNGDVFPCPFVRNWLIGNVREQSLSTILRSDSLLRAWGLFKDRIEVCRDCEFRYMCFDCRAKAPTLFGKPRDCTYDPYTGIGNGVRWRDQTVAKVDQTPLAVGKTTLHKGGGQACYA